MNESNQLNRTQSGASDLGFLLEVLVPKLWPNGPRTIDGNVKMYSGVLGVFLIIR